MSDMGKWRVRAINQATKEKVHATKREDGLTIYKCRGRLFTELRDAVVESAEDGNARSEYMVIAMPWSQFTYWVYDPKGTKVSSHEGEVTAAKEALKLQNSRKRPSEETIKRRRDVYWDERNRWLEARKKVLVEAEKERILSERRSAEQRKQFAPVIGSW